MVKLGMRVRTWDSFPEAKFYIKKSIKGLVPLWQNIPKITNFDDLGDAAHISKATVVTFGVRVRIRDYLVPNFIQIA